MLLLAILFVCAASVPLAGGRLDRLADLRFRGVGVLVAALAVQILILAVLDGADEVLLGAVYLATLCTAGLFIWSNRRIVGIPLIGLGGVLNALAIAANDGVMPARPGALEAAGRPIVEEGFRNSAAVGDPNLAWLGDTFAIPAGWPLANVFSVGDVIIVIGAFVLLHVACGSRLPRLVGWQARPSV